MMGVGGKQLLLIMVVATVAVTLTLTRFQLQWTNLLSKDKKLAGVVIPVIVLDPTFTSHSTTMELLSYPSQCQGIPILLMMVGILLTILVKSASSPASTPTARWIS